MKGYDIEKVAYQAKDRLNVKKILANIRLVHQSCKHNSRLYDLICNNCEQTARFCMTGKSDHDFDEQINLALSGITGIGAIGLHTSMAAFHVHCGNAAKTVSYKCVTALKALFSAADDGSDVATNVSASAASQASKIMASGVGAGMAVAAEIGLQVHRHHKYKNDFSYNTYDYAMDSAESWSTMAATTGIAVTLTLATPIGWFVLLPTIGTFAFCWGMWWSGKKLFGKSEREKWYYEYDIDYEDLKSLENGKTKLEDIIDMFEKCILTDKEKEKFCKKYIILNQIIENIDIDIAYFEYNKTKTNENRRKGDSNLRKLIKKEDYIPIYLYL